MNTWKLWVDDERPAPDESWTWVTNSSSAIWMLSAGIHYAEISLDHDLGGEDTGMIVLDFMSVHRIWPDTLTIHTANPPARKRMLAAANADGPPGMDIYIKHW